jgi:hypothetical protein
MQKKVLSILGGAKTVLVIFNCELRPQTVGKNAQTVRKMHRLYFYPRYIEVIKKVLPSCVLFFARLGNTSETGQNNNNSS